MITTERINGIDDIETLRTVALENFCEFIIYKKEQENEKQQIINENKKLEIQLLIQQEKFALEMRRRWSSTSEKMSRGENKSQPSLFDEAETTIKAEEQEAENPEAGIPVKAHNRIRGKRAKLPASLPRIDEIIDISEEEKICGCGEELVKIGEETSEKLEIIPIQFRVRRTIRPIYACKACGGTENEPEAPVSVAPVPPSILPKTNATPSMLATIAIWKFQDALPLYRQEKIFSRHGIELSRSTTSRWMMEVAKKCRPIIDGIQAHILSSPMIGMDETPVQVLMEEDRKNTTSSYMWVARGSHETPESPGGKIAILFKYHPKRSASVPKDFLTHYSGVLQTDGYETYDSIVKTHAQSEYPIIHAGCMTHARRKFVEAERSGKVLKSSKVALGYFRELYAIEREATDARLNDDARCLLRKEKAIPVLEKFKTWMDGRSLEVPPESLIGKAIFYTLGQWEKLVRYVYYGFVPIDNNQLENGIRPFVIGRKNWLFSGSPDGADASAALYSIIETAKANGLEPFHYLYYLFAKLPFLKTSDEIESILPFNVSKNDVFTFVATHWLGMGS